MQVLNAVRGAGWGCLLIFFCSSVTGCSLLPSEPLPFEWVEAGNRLVFDYHNGAKPFVDPVFGYIYPDTTAAQTIEIETPEWADFQFAYSGTSWSFSHLDGSVVMILDGLFGYPGPERAHDGLRTKYPETCDQGFWKSFKSSLRVPARPRTGQQYALFECGDVVDHTLEVTAVDVEVTVPAGRFTTFVLYIPDWRQKEYWSEHEGLIKVERFYEDGTLLGTYELASKNF